MTDKNKQKNHETGGLRAEKRSSFSSDTTGGITGETDLANNDPAIQQIELEMQILELQNALIELRYTKQQLEDRVREKLVDLRQINEQLRRSQNELKIFAKNTVERLERERRKVSGELHDTVSQGLATINLFLENKLDLMDKEKMPSPSSIESLLEITQDNIDETRRLINYLRPKMLDDLGLLATIQWHWQEFRNRHPELAVKVNLTASETDIPAKLKLVIYRVIQEAADNIARHSQATCIDFEFERIAQSLKLRIRDNGKGFDLGLIQAETLRNAGLTGMKVYIELSGGRFSLRSSQNKGTCIEATWDFGSRQNF